MKISVYITSYNQKEYLKEAIASILGQTLKPHEVIIIDDASTDGSVDLIKYYETKFTGWIRPIYNAKNEGISSCRTKAIESARGDYITWVDGDDYLLPQKLERESMLLKDGKFQIAFSNYYISANELSNYSKIWAYDFGELPKPGNMFKEVISRSFPRGILYRSEMIDLALLRSIDLYDSNLKIYEDYDLRIRLSQKAQITYTVEPQSIYRLHGEGLSRAPLALHYESFKYIFQKYETVIEALPQEERGRIKERMNQMLRNLAPKEETRISLKNRISRKLVGFFR